MKLPLQIAMNYYRIGRYGRSSKQSGFRGAIPKMKKVLITGASGFVGNNLACFLLSRGDEVHLLLREGHAQWRLKDILQDVQVHIADLLIRIASQSREQGSSGMDIPSGGAWSIFISDRHCENSSDQHHGDHQSGPGLFKRQDLKRLSIRDHLRNTVLKIMPRLKTNGSTPIAVMLWPKLQPRLFCRYTARSLGVRIPTLRLYSVYGPYEEPTRLMPR